MKKNIFLLASLCFILNAALGQEIPESFKIRPRIGISGSTFAVEVGQEPRLYPILGVFTTYQFQASWLLSADLLYAPKGARWDRPFPIVNGLGANTFVEVNTRLDYLNLPVQAFFLFNKPNAAFIPKIGAGAYGAFLFNSSSTTLTGTIGLDDFRRFNPFDLGLIGSVGFNYQASQMLILFTDFRYEHGLANINRNLERSFYMANRAISLSIGFVF
jgi:hypothetical protein